MEDITKKQHWVPQFIIREWSKDKNEYKFYDKHIKRYGTGTLEDFKNDIFYRDFLYENEKLFEINEIEKELSKIENDFANILKKKVLKNNNYKVIINRLDLKIIKLYFLIESYRSVVTTARAYNLQGSTAYNNYYKNKDKVKIDKEFLKNLHYLIFDVFKYIKNNVGFLPEKLQEVIEKKLRTIYEIKNDKTKLFKPDNILFTSIQNVNHNTCLKIIKIKDDISYNFLLTDSRHVQFFGNPPDNIYGSILMIMPVTPRYTIAFLKLNYFNHREPSPFAKGTIWDYKFPGLFEVNQEWELNQKQEVSSELEKEINKNPKIEEDKYFSLEKKVIMKYCNNKDLYYYPIYELKYDEQVHLINAMLHSQTYEYVSYLQGKDLLKAIETIKLYKIYRIEETI